MMASATDASTWVIGLVSDAAIVWRMLNPRTAWLARSKRLDSYSCPPKTLTTRWHSIVSSSTCARSIECHRRSEEHTSELQSRPHLVCRLLLEKKKSYNPCSYLNEHRR